LLNLAGIPPLAGFFGKLFVIWQQIFLGNYYIAVFLVLFSVLGCVYYLRFVIKLMFNKTPTEGSKNYIIKIESDYQVYLIFFLTCINCLFIFLQFGLTIIIHLIDYLL
jgi:NADH:ubiquinone oxidoreductase subunit 2 (subunit N)